jgi:hypothetical protein
MQMNQAPDQNLKQNPLENLLAFLAKLDHHKIFYRLSRPRSEAIMVEIAVPGERWEVEFFGDGHLEIEIFGPGSSMSDGASLERLWTQFSDAS